MSIPLSTYIPSITARAYVASISRRMDQWSLRQSTQEGTIVAFEVSTDKQTLETNAHEPRIWSLDLSSNGRTLVSGGDDKWSRSGTCNTNNHKQKEAIMLRGITTILLVVILPTLAAQANAADRPTLAKVVVNREAIVGELLERTDKHVRILEISTNELRTINTDNFKSLRVDIFGRGSGSVGGTSRVFGLEH